MCHRNALGVVFGMMCLAFMAWTAPAQVENLAYNPSAEEDESFTDDLQWSMWHLRDGMGSEAAFDDTESIDGERSLRIDPIGTNEDLQVNVGNEVIPLEVGKTYTASFWAKAEAEKKLGVMWSNKEAAWISVEWGYTQFELTTEWAEYALTNEAQHANGKLNFLCGHNEATLWLDFVWVYEGEYVSGIEPSAMPRSKATGPSPSDGATDVSRSVVLGWTPGMTAATRDLYVGESFEAVEGATVPTVSSLDINSFDLGRLDLGQTVFWRVDEVNGPPDRAVFKGDVWRFDVDPYSIPISRGSMDVTASSTSHELSASGPARTIDGSGLDAHGMHDSDPGHMWFTSAGDLDPWIQYEFDNVKKLDMMKVWNANAAPDVTPVNGAPVATIGCGVKDVLIEYSVDGETWNALADAIQFSRAPGVPDYDQYDAIDFGGVPAKYVRLNILSNWGSVFQSYGLSEVQFFEIPVKARTPDPVVRAKDIHPDTILTWRAGREAAQHTVYIGTELDAVVEGTAPSVTTQTNSLDTTSLDLHLDQTYYWRVDEVNEAESWAVWPGPAWRFKTCAAICVDDFDHYNNFSPNRPFETWLDGLGYSPSEFFPVAYGGNGTGAAVGHDIWSLTSEHRNGDLMDADITLKGSAQSMPFYYDNSTAAPTSETTVDVANLEVGQDWTRHGMGTLALHFRAHSLSEALDTTLTFTAGGDAGWFSQTAVSHDGSDAARSRDISDYQRSVMQTTVNGPGTVSFCQKVSCEWYDSLQFYIDGRLRGEFPGDMSKGWFSAVYTIAGPGPHTLEWRYDKSAGWSGGEDCAWVDEVKWDGKEQPATMPVGNTGQLYAKINGVRVDYPGSVADLKWTKWKIDLASLGVDLQNVTTLTIGIDGDDASGVLYLDNFLLEPGE